MLISRQWLQNYFDAPLPPAEELGEALTFHAFEIDGIEKKGEDDILDVKVTPNRGHDCLSHRGIAAELSAILKLPLNSKDPFAAKPDLSKKTDAVTVSIEDPALCQRYIAGLITGVTIKPSPEWLVKSLEAIGQRSINNVVDATNLVMFNTGQPLHAFDADRLGGLAIGVRRARQDEEMEALDKKKYALVPSMLVITAQDRPVGIAGVKGGMADRIDEQTKDILIESATFDGAAIRKTAQSLKLRTDASARFEQQLSPELAAYGMQQVADLIVAIAGGEMAGFVDAYPAPQEEKRVSVTLEQINSALGITLTGAEVADTFVRLKFPYKEEGGAFEIVVPLWRLDLEIAEDLIEEVGRIIGYDRVPATPLPPLGMVPAVNPAFYAAEALREQLAAEGYSEIYTSVFSDKGERVVLNKIDGVRPYLRESLIPGLADAWVRNFFNIDLLGLKELKLFEIGTIWKNGEEVVMVGKMEGNNCVKKDKLKNVLEESLVDWEEKPLTDYVKNTPVSYDQSRLSTTQRYQQFSRYPYIVRDIALWCPAGTRPEDILSLIRAEAGPLLAQSYLFDQFEKEGRVSLAFRLVFQSFERTLEDAEANGVMERISTAMREKGFEVR